MTATSSQTPARVLWLAKGAYGDAFVQLGTLELLHHLFVPVQVMVVGSPAVAQVLGASPHVAQVVALPKPYQWMAVGPARRAVTAFGPRVVFLCHEKTPVPQLARAATGTGAALVDCVNRLLVQGGDGPVPVTGARQLVDWLADTLGRPPAHVPWPRPPVAWRGAGEAPPREGVALAPFASTAWPSKEWPLAHYEALARQLVAAGHPVRWLGTAAERERLGPLVHLEGTAWWGGGGLGDLGRELSSVRASVSSESMVAHAAPLFGAVPVRVVGPTGHEHVSRFPGRPAPVTLCREDLACLGCHRKRCPLPVPQFHQCMTGLSVDEVAGRVLAVLADPPPPVAELDLTPGGVWTDNFA